MDNVTTIETVSIEKKKKIIQQLYQAVSNYKKPFGWSRIYNNSAEYFHFYKLEENSSNITFFV